MKATEIKKAVELMERYNSMGCGSIKELSKATYALRESGVDIPYVGVLQNGGNKYGYSYPAPTSRQRNWSFLTAYKYSDVWMSPDGYTNLWIYETGKGLLFLVETRRRISDGELVIKVEYSNRPVLAQEYKEHIWSGRSDFDKEVIFQGILNQRSF